ACEVYRVYDEERDSLTHRAAPDTGPEVRAVDVHPALLTGCGHGFEDHVRHGLGLGTITTFDQFLLSAERAERGAELLGEELRLLPGGEVPAPRGLVEVDDVRIGVLDPAARRAEDLAGEGGERDRQRDRRRRLAGGLCRGPAA